MLSLFSLIMAWIFSLASFSLCCLIYALCDLVNVILVLLDHGLDIFFGFILTLLPHFILSVILSMLSLFSLIMAWIFSLASFSLCCLISSTLLTLALRASTTLALSS